MGCGRTLALAALYHHCYYNGKGGYPKDVSSCPPEIKGIVDALSVADSLDAATDNIGRCYNLAKPFRTLLGELRAQSGTSWQRTRMPSAKGCICRCITPEVKKNKYHKQKEPLGLTSPVSTGK